MATTTAGLSAAGNGTDIVVYQRGNDYNLYYTWVAESGSPSSGWANARYRDPGNGSSPSAPSVTSITTNNGPPSPSRPEV